MIKRKIFITTLFSLVLFSLIFTVPVFSEIQTDSGNGGIQTDSGGGIIQNPLKDGVNNFYDLVKLIIDNIVIPFGFVVIVLMIIFAGFQFVVAQGNEQKITDAKQTLLYAVIGAVILLGSWAIAGIIENTINQVTGKDLIG